MGVTIDWTNIKSWSKYQSYGDKGYHKMAYLRRYDGVNSYWYGEGIIKANTLVIDRYCTASNYLELGNVTAAALSFTISAPPNDITSWAIGDELEVQIDPDDRGTISTPSADCAYMGIFVIDSIKVRDGNYFIEALDRMVYLDQDMDWTGFSTNYPIQTVLSNIATQCGITLANSISGFPNANVGWYSNPTMTCRQVVSAIAEVIGACAYMDWDGELRFAWYEPQLDANSNTLEIGSDIAFNRYTKDTAYVIDSFVIGDSNSSTIDADDDGTATYSIIGNALVESARDYVTVSTWADNITAARYTNVTNPYRLFHGGEYEVLPFPYIWPLDVLCVGSDYVPITHVTYRHNANMSLTADVTPVTTKASTFTSAQQTVINNMQGETEAINKHFFYANATGAHVTTVENDPDSGNNVLIDSTGLYLRENTDVLAEFTTTGATIGQSGEPQVSINASEISLLTGTANKDVVIKSEANGAAVEFSPNATEGAARLGTNTLTSSEKEFAMESTSSNANRTAITGVYALNDGVSGLPDDTFGAGLELFSPSNAGGGQNAMAFLGRVVRNGTDYYVYEGLALDLPGDGTDFFQSSVPAEFLHGVTVTGDVTCGQIKTNSYIRFTSANNPTYAYTYIVAVDGDANGSVMLIRPGASLILGGGEYASNRWGVGDISVTNEQTYLGADSAVYIESNGNTIANRKTWQFYNGNITAPNGAIIEVPYKGETETVTTIYGYGYTGATGNPNKYNYYFEVPLPRKIASGSTITVTALTGAIRGVNGLVAANATDLVGNIATASRGNNGLLHMNIQNISTNWAQNTPASIIINSITFTVS